MASPCCPIMVFPDACQQEEELDLSPDDEEQTMVRDEQEEDPYEYDDELPGMPDCAAPNLLDDDLFLEGKQFGSRARGKMMCVAK